ncbi:MAG: hypothetical protein EOO80_02900 [Oxalobacteraceae bacterium]|nr:MAG: hypothetical protein EOO80_02900 [Oxalobacteraceae bacterium]
MSDQSRMLWEQAVAESIAGQGGGMPVAEAGAFAGAGIVTARPAGTIASRPPAMPITVTSGVTAPAVATRTSVNRIPVETAAVTRPVWSRDRLPVRVSAPLVTDATPIVAGKFLLRAAPDDNIIYVAPAEPALLDFALTIRRSVLPDRSLAITGATAFFSIGAYASNGIESIARQSAAWKTALSAKQINGREWSYRAEPERALRVSLELPPGMAASAPMISLSQLAGVATITVELTESGTLAWKAALEQGSAATIPGILHVSTGTLRLDNVAMRLDRRTLDVAVGRLLAARSGADIRYIDPQQTVVSKLIVVANDLVERMTVALNPSQGQAPASAAGPNPQTQGVLNFTAPYVANGLLNSSFLADYYRPLNIALPRFPGQAFGDLVMTVFATRNGVGGNKSRKIGATELNVIALVYPDGHIDLVTGSDALPERSAVAENLRVLEAA